MAVAVITATQLRAARPGHADATEWRRVADVAVALVEAYAPAAPEAVKLEAAFRVAGWLLDSPASNLAAEEVGQQSATYAPGQRGALRHSGAMSILSPWKVRRAGAVGGGATAPRTPPPTPVPTPPPTPEDTMPTVRFYLVDFEAGVSGFPELAGWDAARWVSAGAEVAAPPTARAVSVAAPVMCHQRRFTATEKPGIQFRWAAVAVPSGTAAPSHFRRSDDVPADDWGERWRLATGHADIGGTSHAVFWFPQVIGGGGVDYPARHVFEWPL